MRNQFSQLMLLIALAAAMVLPTRALAANSNADPIINAPWLGEYYSNPDLLGRAAVVRNDGSIDFNWGYGAPDSALPADGFSVRWTSSRSLSAGSYRFYAISDDGVRVYLDGMLIIDQWHDAAGNTYVAEQRVSAGSHQFRVEYYENGGGARISFWWERVDANAYPDWKGEYYANSSLSGSPTLVRNDKVIDFAWGYNAPDPALPVDDFSVRWTRSAYFEAATYRFHAVTDGSITLWLGSQILIDRWHDGSVREFTADFKPARGDYSVKVEFIEGSGSARVKVWWEKVYLPYNPDPRYPDWRGQYWANQELQGNPSLVRNDREIDFDWGTGAAAPGLPADKFSARWDRLVNFAPGTYTFYARADNGIRVYLDGVPIIDQWYSNSQQLHAVARTLSGSHHLAVEYYENGGPAMVEFWWE